MGSVTHSFGEYGLGKSHIFIGFPAKFFVLKDLNIPGCFVPIKEKIYEISNNGFSEKMERLFWT